MFFIKQKTLFSFRPTQLLKLSRTQRIVTSKFNVNDIIIIIVVFAVWVVHSFVFLRFQQPILPVEWSYSAQSHKFQVYKIHISSMTISFFVVCLSFASWKWNAFRILLNRFVIERTKIQHFLHTQQTKITEIIRHKRSRCNNEIKINKYSTLSFIHLSFSMPFFLSFIHWVHGPRENKKCICK